MRWFSLLASLLCLSGCHSALAEAMDSYADGRYPTAAAQFRAAEPAARELSPRDFANYALYRGLTHLALGDAQAGAPGSHPEGHAGRDRAGPERQQREVAAPEIGQGI